MGLPTHTRYLIVGAGVHGLSTGYHLARELRARGKGSGADILIVDKTDVAAGASGIACGVIRNNYFQPAMRALMAHSVSVWESDPEALSYHPVGYMQISPEVMHEGVASIHAQQRAIGYPSVFIEGAADCLTYMRGIFHDWQAKGITSVLHEQKGGYANNKAAMAGLARKALAEGVRIEPGVRVRGLRLSGGAVSAAETDRGVISADYVVVGVGPWIRSIWAMLDLPMAITVVHNGAAHPNVTMWRYLCLQEGTLGVDPTLQQTNDGRMPPVIHVDTDAPLHADPDGALITDQLWGIYYKPDFMFNGVQGGAAPYLVDQDEVRIDPYGPASPEFVVGEEFVRMWCSGPGLLPEALRGAVPPLPARAVRGPRRLHAGQLPGVRRLPPELLRDRGLEPRVQDDRGRRAGRQGDLGRAERDPPAVSVLALRRGSLHPVSASPFPWS